MGVYFPFFIEICENITRTSFLKPHTYGGKQQFNMPVCCVMTCGARKTENEPQFSLHRIPRNEGVRKKWLEAIGEKNINPRQKVWYICSHHFEESCFIRTLDVMRLKDNSFPTIFSMNGRSTGVGNESACSISLEENSQENIIKNEHNDESVCRVCLKEGGIPIYENKTAEDLAESFNVFAGIEIRIDDPYPKYLCQPCYSLLQGAILFRKTAQQSDEILKQPTEDLLTADNNDTFDYPEDDSISWEYEPKDKKNKIYHCKKCEISFDTFKEYDEHRQTEEHENKKIVCPVCNNPYTELYFKKHLALHKEKPSYMCDICGKNFIVQGHFTRHRLTHFYKLPFKCSLCPYRGRFTESLKMHMRQHTGERPYQCAQCPSRFINKSNLNKHTLTHKGEHDFRCETCGRGFYTKRELELHYKVDHTGIKEHVCNICGKAFGYRKQMMKHQLKVHKRAKLKSGRMPLYLQVETMKQQGLSIEN